MLATQSRSIPSCLSRTYSTLWSAWRSLTSWPNWIQLYAGNISLIQAGASQIATDYENGSIVGLRWTMKVCGRDVLFAMPARVDPIYNILRKRRSGYFSSTDEANTRAKARRVAWRQLLRWTQAQLAMIECGMTEPSEVFFPYIQTGTGQSLFEAFKGSEFKQLAAPERPS